MIKNIGCILVMVFFLSALQIGAFAKIFWFNTAHKSISTAEAAKVVKVKKAKKKIVKKAAPKAVKPLTVSSPAAIQPPPAMPVLAPASTVAPAGGPQQPETPGPAPSSMGY
jgi:hypothetical protein